MKSLNLIIIVNVSSKSNNLIIDSFENINLKENNKERTDINMKTKDKIKIKKKKKKKKKGKKIIEKDENIIDDNLIKNINNISNINYINNNTSFDIYNNIINNINMY